MKRLFSIFLNKPKIVLSVILKMYRQMYTFSEQNRIKKIAQKIRILLNNRVIISYFGQKTKTNIASVESCSMFNDIFNMKVFDFCAIVDLS